MIKYTSLHSQRGITLLIGLIMLILITLTVVTAFKFSNVNSKAVGNMQVKNEANAAANIAIEQVLSSSFTDDPVAEPKLEVDLNHDGNVDYTVSVSKPKCVRAAIDSAGAKSSLSLGSEMTSQDSWNTVWEIEAEVDDTKTGAKTSVSSGVRVLLAQDQKDKVCI